MKTFKCKICGTVISSKNRVEICEACGANKMIHLKEKTLSNIDWSLVANIVARLSMLGIVLGSIGLSIWMVFH